MLINKLDQEEVTYVENTLVTGQDQVTHQKKMQKILINYIRPDYE